MTTRTPKVGDTVLFQPTKYDYDLLVFARVDEHETTIDNCRPYEPLAAIVTASRGQDCFDLLVLPPLGPPIPRARVGRWNGKGNDAKFGGWYHDEVQPPPCESDCEFDGPHPSHPCGSPVG